MRIWQEFSPLDRGFFQIAIVEPMQSRIPKFIKFLIPLISLFAAGSYAIHSEIDAVPPRLGEKPEQEVASYLFAIDSFSEEKKFSAPMGVFYDRYNDEIYVADTGNDQLDVFDTEGRPRFQISRVQGMRAPLDVVVDSESQIYVSQMGKNVLQLFSFRGERLADMYAPDSAPFSPGRACLDSEENLYVIDREKAEILVYDAAGDFKFRFGGKNEGVGGFSMISGIAVDSAGRIYIADSKRHTPIQVFDKVGHFLLSFGKRGVRDAEFAFTGGVCIDEKDRIWIADTFKHQIKVLKTDGTFLFQFGVFGKEPGQFFFPIDLCLDGKGRAYVLDKGANRLQVFEIHGW